MVPFYNNYTVGNVGQVASVQLRCNDEGKNLILETGADYNMPRTFSDELTGTSVPVGQVLELREGNYLYHVKYDIDHQTTSDLQSAFAFRAVPTTGSDAGIAGTSDSSGFFIQDEDWQTQVC